MSARLLWLLISALPSAPAPTPSDTDRLILLAKEDLYRKAEGQEVTLEGILERAPSSTTAPPSHLNLFRLRWDNEGRIVVHELHVPGKAHLLAAHVDKRVRVLGKLVVTKVDGKPRQELWPAWMEPLSRNPTAAPGADGVFARCDWQPDEARVRGERRYVFRSGEELAKAMRLSGPSAGETATRLLARRLRVSAIDWRKHMLVCVSAGLQTSAVEGLRIVWAADRDGETRIMYRLVPGKSGGFSFGYPAETALMPRHDGTVKFDRATDTPSPKRD